MIIRATQYLYRLSGVPSVKNTEEPPSPFPGEWYANFVERFDGRYNAIHFLHNPTRISVLVPGPFLDQSISGFRERATALLMRKGYEIEHHLSMPEIAGEINVDWIEDIQLRYLFPSGKKTMNYITAKEILDEVMSNLP